MVGAAIEFGDRLRELQGHSVANGLPSMGWGPPSRTRNEVIASTTLAGGFSELAFDPCSTSEERAVEFAAETNENMARDANAERLMRGLPLISSQHPMTAAEDNALKMRLIVSFMRPSPLKTAEAAHRLKVQQTINFIQCANASAAEYSVAMAIIEMHTA
ncbi:hypothetical protein T492DRAFT_1098109 [Pavlovales sp. CCMP2436]|nr:hypothetical protein T492DRAFT_1098109 [Pavlovales sp. CCMP2436]|mmetsp:Transcript_15456/g.39211  ORF Transcript_15456/g.39211 Transcript_15456/m.39211 type:complete len:160 (-) Transcript_15456:106-585(-)